MASTHSVQAGSDVRLGKIQQLVRHLDRLSRNARLYDRDHPTLKGMHEQLCQRWEAATRDGELELDLDARQVLWQDELVHEATSIQDPVPTLLYEHGIIRIVLLPGLTSGEAVRLTAVLSQNPDPFLDYVELLWAADLGHFEFVLEDDVIADLEDATPEGYAREIDQMVEQEDAPVRPDYEEEYREMAGLLGDGLEPAADAFDSPDRFQLTERERVRVHRLVKSDTYEGTLQHAGRIVHLLAEAETPHAELPVLKAITRKVAAHLTEFGNPDGIVEFLTRAAAMAESQSPLEQQMAALSAEPFRDPERLHALFRRLDARAELPTIELGELMVALGPEAIPVACRWLPESRHPESVAEVLGTFGDAVVDAFVPLYRQSSGETRRRIAGVLLEIATSESLEPLAADFVQLPPDGRLQLVERLKLAGEQGPRAFLSHALHDGSRNVRHAAIQALQRCDARWLGAELEATIDRFMTERTPEEREAFFGALANLANLEIARSLASRCLQGGLKMRLKGLSPLQELCVRALRRARDADARRVTEELRAKGPRTVRDALNDPLADLA